MTAAGDACSARGGASRSETASATHSTTGSASSASSASASAASTTASAGSAAQLLAQLPLRRRRLGLAVVAAGVVALASQSLLEWLLPADPAAHALVRRLLHWPGLGIVPLTWLVWALPSLLLLFALARTRRRPWPSALACGLLLGSAQLAVGALAALMLLLLVGLASMGWHGRGEGGLALLLSAAAAVAGWDWLLAPAYPSLWLVALVVVAMVSGTDRRQIRANDRRLFAALVERDTLITRLDERSAELTALQGARTRLLAGISHDLRQPLQAVRLFGEALQRQLSGQAQTPQVRGAPAPPHASGADAARAHELLRQQLRAADDATAMLDQFSEFSAIEQGALQSHPEAVDLLALLDGIAANLQAAHAPAVLTLRVHGRRPRQHGEHGHHWLHTDRTQLTRLLQNLAGNAVRYSLGARPGQRARVVLALRPWREPDGGAGLAIDIIDNGRGIPPDQLDAVFEPYVQLAPDGGRGASGRGGHGLGLAIVRGLALQLGLQLAPLRSRVGHGTRARVLVPAALRLPPPAAEGEAREAGAAVSDPATAATPFASGRAGADDPTRLDGWLLALLDDEDAPRAALRTALESTGATTIDAATLAALRERLDDEPRFPDALVFDLDLGPGSADGLAALAALRHDWELPQLPAVIVTGRLAARGTVALPAGCVLLAKPVGLATLVGTLRRLRT